MSKQTQNHQIDRRKLGLMLAAGLLAPSGAAHANGDPLGTSRTLHVSGQGGPRFGRKTYPASLPLVDGEVILTFDDGPLPATTNAILDALARENVKATFFMIGRNALANPQTVRRVAGAGHTLANHTLNHPWTMRQRSTQNGVQEIVQGEDAIQQAVGHRIAPFFRFPGFADTPPLLAELARRNNVVWGADIWASDWKSMSPETQLQLVMARLVRQRKGILLFHDIKQQTAAMLPGFLRALKVGGFRVVHAMG
jgi:peptidoglycan-N-acetylglucosamine deacetylase